MRLSCDALSFKTANRGARREMRPQTGVGGSAPRPRTVGCACDPRGVRAGDYRSARGTYGRWPWPM
jgi:hypothetical protein